MFNSFGNLRLSGICLFLWAATSPLMAQTVLNAGHGGDNTRNLLKRLDADVLSHHPKLVVVLVGTNDVLNSANSVGLDEYRKNLETLIQRIRASSAQVVLVTPPPCYPPYLLKRHPAAFFQGKDPNEKLAEVRSVDQALGTSKKMPVVDLSVVFGDGWKKNEADSLLRNVANSKSEDGVHPTAAGYRAIAEVVASVIRKEGLPTDSIVCFGDSITFGIGAEGVGTAEGETYPACLARLLEAPATGEATPKPEGKPN